MIEEEEVNTDVDTSPPPDPPVTFATKMKRFLAVHWRGILIVITPIISLCVVLPAPTPPYLWVAYTLIIMAVFWMTECLPLAVSAFLPVVIFPISGVMTSDLTCKAYMNDTIIMFLGSLMMAYSVEQSGLHKRLAFATIQLIGFSHVRLIAGICIVTTFVSMWVTNTAATTMMVPINFAILKVLSDNNFITMYEYNAENEKRATEIMSCYFCITTFSATIGGIGTLVGTATNLVFKGLFMTDYPNAPEYLSFPLFSAFAIPYMIVMEVALFLNLTIVYFGLFRPNSGAAKRSFIDKRGKDAATEMIKADAKKIGSLSFWELMVLILFGGAMVAFFSRSPQIFPGWSDKIREAFGITNKLFIQDSSLAALVSFLMLLLPSTTVIIKNFKAKTYEELPKGRVTSVLDWSVLNRDMPYSFMFLLGGGFALSTASSRSGLNAKIGQALQFLSAWPNEAVSLVLIIIVTLVTNFASNVAVANVFVPIAMSLAKQIKRNPLWYNIATGFSASYCFMLPVGTPGNLIAQSAASIPTTSMMKLGAGPTVSIIIITWLAVTYWAPVIWPDLKEMPDWIESASTTI